MSTKYKYLDKHHLNQINHISENVLKYNRTIPQDVIDSLPDDRFFPITFTMLHEHRAGVACEPHVRCIIGARDKNDEPVTLILDIDSALFDVLPEVEIPDPDPKPETEEIGAT